ncbi:MAG: class I SAM-dependent methyltransferase [bacterium]
MIKDLIKKVPPLFYVFSKLYRGNIAFSYYKKPLKNIVKWLFTSKETTNFTFPISEMNKQYLASLIATIAKTNYNTVYGYFTEIEEDKNLRNHLAKAIKNSSRNFVTDPYPLYGRRIGWYAFVRILKPKIVIETGVEKGLGSCVLTCALKKNDEEGFKGYYYGTDINPEAGFLFGGEYKKYGEILYGDSITSLKKLECNIDLFINDSDHSADYENDEYMTIYKQLSENAIILGDNSHCTTKLLEFSRLMKRQFIFFKEEPENHWYPGAGIGISFKNELR